MTEDFFLRALKLLVGWVGTTTLLWCQRMSTPLFFLDCVMAPRRLTILTNAQELLKERVYSSWDLPNTSDKWYIYIHHHHQDVKCHHLHIRYQASCDDLTTHRGLLPGVGGTNLKTYSGSESLDSSCMNRSYEPFASFEWWVRWWSFAEAHQRQGWIAQCRWG